MLENALFCPPKQQAVVISYTALSLITVNHRIPYIPQAVHSTTSRTIFFNPPPKFITHLWFGVWYFVGFGMCVGLSLVVTVIVVRSDGFVVHDILIMAY
jgi:hypothetical protein